MSLSKCPKWINHERLLAFRTVVDYGGSLISDPPSAYDALGLEGLRDCGDSGIHSGSLQSYLRELEGNKNDH